MAKEELASLNQLLLIIRKEYIKPISSYLSVQFSEIARFFKTVILWLVNIWNEKIPDTFVITKEQYVILVIACLILCFHRDKKKKKAKKSKKQDAIQAENEQNIVEDQTQVGQEGEETTQIPVDQKSDEEVL